MDFAFPHLAGAPESRSFPDIRDPGDFDTVTHTRQSPEREHGKDASLFLHRSYISFA